MNYPYSFNSPSQKPQQRSYLPEKPHSPNDPIRLLKARPESPDDPHPPAYHDYPRWTANPDKLLSPMLQGGGAQSTYADLERQEQEKRDEMRRIEAEALELHRREKERN